MCVLSAIGTAAIINPQFTMSEANKAQSMAPILITPKDNDLLRDMRGLNVGAQKPNETDGDNEVFNTKLPTGCSLCHIPHNKIGLPVSGKMKKCSICK